MSTPRKIRGFAFLGTPAQMMCELPFPLSHDITLTRATISQRRDIKRYLRSLGGHLHNVEPFECQFNEISLPPIHGIQAVELHRKRLPSSEWRYYVVQFRRCTMMGDAFGCQELKLLRVSSHLTGQPLYLNPFFYGAITSDFTSDWEYFTGIAGNGGDVISIELAYLEDLRNCYSAVQRVSLSHPEIGRSIDLYCEIPSRHGQNELTTLGLFAVLESLMTHSPRGETDSIGQQIRKKIALVEKRLRIPISYDYFGAAPKETIWNKLYELRSRIAHGSPVDFDRVLVLLDDSYNVELFLWAALRSLLRGAIEEPELFVDLKAV